jgi:hypothetical protein
MQTLLERLESSIDDAVLTTAEKHALAADLKARPWRLDQLRQLRNHAFELVLTRARDPLQSATMPALVKWLNEVVKVIDQTLPPVHIESEVWFSPGEECRAALIGQLQSCRQRLDICVFTIADDSLTEAILAASRCG